jgi:hypothetical protein
VAGLTAPPPDSTRETVAMPTPAAAATSLMVTARAMALSMTDDGNVSNLSLEDPSNSPADLRSYRASVQAFYRPILDRTKRCLMKCGGNVFI